MWEVLPLPLPNCREGNPLPIMMSSFAMGEPLWLSAANKRKPSFSSEFGFLGC
jgi:hypothetical protein